MSKVDGIEIHGLKFDYYSNEHDTYLLYVLLYGLFLPFIVLRVCSCHYGRYKEGWFTVI